MTDSVILGMMQPVIDKVEEPGLRKALDVAVNQEVDALHQAERTFHLFSERRHDGAVARTFMKSWHSTHLKMLPIYGLSCRLQKLGMSSDGEQRSDFFTAAAHNAETSYEDLNLEAEYPYTHTELYDQLAETVCGDDGWRQDRYCTSQASDFRKWVYRTMVDDPIETGLFCNLFSEIYNHGEYASAVVPFEQMLKEHYGLSEQQAHELSVYIRCHVDSNVEEAHFNCVINALEHYNKAAGRQTDYAKAESLFRDYLRRSASVMAGLEVALRDASA